MEALLRLARHHGGSFTARAANDLGYRSRELGELVEADLLVRLRRGVYAIAAEHRTLSVRDAHVLATRDAVERLGAGHAASHDSALLVHRLANDGLDLPEGRLDLDVSHVSRVGGTTSRRRNRIQTHRDALEAGDVVDRDGLATVRADLAVAQVMTCRPLAVGAVVASSWLASCRSDARRRGMVEAFDEPAHKAELTAVLDGLGRRPGGRTARSALEIADARCDSVGEVLVLLTCWLHAVPRPETQYWIALPDDRWAEVDFCWPDVRLVLEFDGKGKDEDERAPDGRIVRSGKQKLWAEKRREDDIRGLRYHVVRITWADLLPHNRERTAARIMREREVAARLYRR
ncbi:type IV toxin-antitoxin system AbiEi family antitoxin domain-containing protein [Mumia sp. DW29H23]|uniref:type IV toxin-antitoxin system AbiEi family antitoxin domain-containing protein n=1 Tax=Mumia sp. DW29H23 TaxID=3421241 RepID=UPI003D696B48